MKKFLSISLTTLFAIAVFFFIITFSIGLPIYCRFFYYLQIKPLGLTESTGYDYNTIKTAYDQVLNYLTLPNTTFSTGVFKHSISGASHFADCKVLFDINLTVLVLSSTIIVALIILSKYGVVKLCRPFGFSSAFFSAVSVFAVILILIVVVSIDFDSAFIVFHKIFFAGKDNWTFNSSVDEIIKILPQEFFMSCAIFIGIGVVTISLGIIIFQIINKKRQNN